MGYSRSDEDWQADHYRDEQKHDFAPMTRLDPAPMSEAMKIAVLVKGLRRLDEGAAAIEQFARTYASGEKLDAGTELDRMMAAVPQRCAAAKLVGYCEGLAGSATLPLETETQLRRLIAETLSAFGMSASNRDERETV